MIVCLVLTLSFIEVTGQFAQYLQDFRSQRKFLDEGFEYILENPSFAYNNFADQYYPQTARQYHPHPRNQYYQPEGNTYNKRTIPQSNPWYDALFGGLSTTSNNANYQSEFALSKGFLDEGLEHIKKRGTVGQMQSLLSNPSIFLSSLLL